MYQKISCDARLIVAQDASLNSTLHVAGDATLGANLSAIAASAINLGSTITTTTIHGNTQIGTSATDVIAMGEPTQTVTFNGSIDVKKDATIESRLLVSQDASLNSRLFVGADASFNGKLFVSQDASFNSKLTVGAITLHDAQYSTPNRISTTSGNLVLSSANNGQVYVPGSLTVDGNITVTGQMTTTNTIVNVTEAFDVSNSGTRTALTVEQYQSGQDIASFGYSTTDSVFTVGKNHSVGINKSTEGANGFDYALDISGTVGISDKLSVFNDASFGGKIIANADASLNSTLHVGGIATFNSKLIAITDASFNANVAIGGNLALSNTMAVQFLDQSAYW